MITVSLLKYIILDKCLEIFFRHIHLNFIKPSEECKELLYRIYKIYKRQKEDEGINVGNFENFFIEEMSIYSTVNDPIRLMRSQLEHLEKEYPEYSY